MESSPLNPDSGTRDEWSLPKRLCFRFGFSYFWIFSILAFQFPLNLIMELSRGASNLNDSVGAKLQKFWTNFFEWQTPHLERWQGLVAQFGTRVLGLTETVDVSQSGSGDKIEDLNQIVLIALIALVVTVLWTIVSRKRSHPKLAHWLWIGARIFLASTMLGYGFAKVIKTQFGEPSLAALTTPLGDLAPMTLVWTFMGFSTPYTIFAGAGEVLGGILLAFRRTATLGAMVTFGVMINVTMLNYCFDVPVKFYATYYTLLAILITLPDAGRLFSVLVLHRAVPARSLAGPFRSAALNHSITLLTWIWVATTTVDSIQGGLRMYREFGDGRTKPQWYGVYEVIEFKRNGEVVPPRLDDDSRWNKLIIDRPQTATLVMTSGKWVSCSASYDLPGKLVIEPPPQESDPTQQYPKFAKILGGILGVRKPTYTIDEIEPKRYRIRGVYQGAEIEATVRRRTREDFELTGRGFHWLNPLPYQRLRRG